MSTGSEMLKQTKLWQLFAGKAAETAFVTAVESICCKGITISKDINRFFPNFTLHDETHIQNVCDWMIHLLGDKKDDLTDKEAALLVMSACCHDIGMAVSETQETTLLNDRKVKEYLRDNPRTHDAYMAAHETVTDELLRHYVRTHHHERVGTHISLGEWPEVLTAKGIARNTLLYVCKSHGEPLRDFHYRQSETLDLGLCAILLRLADILDFDSSRAPAPLFDHLNLTNADTFEKRVSQTEWKKNATGGFEITKKGLVCFNARFDSLSLEMEIHSYIDWVKEELEASSEYLTEKGTDRWKTLYLPQTVVLGEIDRNGYQFGDFRLTMDQDRVLELLSGENLYEDASVFVRELLQNAIDAVLHRCDLDPAFKPENALISVYTWTDEEGYDWFRIEDNGVGMNESIITKYFLKVGRSYYESEDYRIAMDNRRDNSSKTHTPISRFGIGILSCFMGDKEDNRIEVSTKQFTLDGRGEPGIRLNVDGLHGYYYMACEDKSDDELLKTMHHRHSKCDDGYRTEIGTTICVRCHTYQLGNYGSLKDILDKYVAFPEVRVEYYGPNGEKHTYMTQHELAEWAHSMNPEGPGKPFKQYEWRIPNEYLKLFPDGFSVEWEEQPTMVGEVIPLDWCTHNPDVNGVFLRLVPKKSTQNGVVSIGGASAPVKWEIAPDIVIRFKDERIDEAEKRMNHGSSRILWTMFRRNQNWRLFTNPDDIISTFKHSLESGCPPELFQQWEKEFREKLVPYADVLPFCSCRSRPCELPSDMVSDCFNVHSELERYLTGDCRDFVAYNGVRANFGSNHYSRPCFTFLLLCGSERPDSDVSREFIRHMPVSVDCAITEINRIIGPHFLRIPTNRWDHNDNSVSEWQEFLGQHSWIQEISVSITENGIRREIPIKNLSSFVDNSATNIADGDSIAIYQLEMDVLDTLVFAVLCDKYGISISSDSSSFIIRKSKVHSNIPLFSPGIFVLPKDDAEYRWAHVSRINKRYNVRHPRSQWLLDNAKNLHKELPDIFNRIIRAMACIDDHQEIITAVNTCLQQIQRYNGNKFKVTERLFINEDDFE